MSRSDAWAARSNAGGLGDETADSGLKGEESWFRWNGLFGGEAI